ncbi:MAG: transglycosylase family protein [Nitriliruptoraceae bacterium]
MPVRALARRRLPSLAVLLAVVVTLSVPLLVDGPDDRHWTRDPDLAMDAPRTIWAKDGPPQADLDHRIVEIDAMMRTSHVVGPDQAAVDPDDGVWQRLADCEASGNWAANTGNGYYGGLQFALGTWRGVGGTGMPHEAPVHQQIAMAERVLERQGWGAWPSCSRRLGLR